MHCENPTSGVELSWDYWINIIGVWSCTSEIRARLAKEGRKPRLKLHDSSLVSLEEWEFGGAGAAGATKQGQGTTFWWGGGRDGDGKRRIIAKAGATHLNE